MVSLDSRNQFIDDLRNSQSGCFTLALVLNEQRAPANPVTLDDRAALAVISSDARAFGEVVAELELRKVNPDADWVLDDFLLFTLLVGAMKFSVGKQLCKAIISERRPTNEMDISLNDSLRSLSRDALAVEGAFSFVKLVFCDLVGRLRIDKAIARTVYDELTNPEMIRQLATFPRLLAYRAFDILVRNGIEEKLDSADAIVSAIESQAGNLSIGDWWRIALAMRPAALLWIGGVLVALCTASFSMGRWLIPDSKPTEAVPKAIQPQTINNAGKS
jgi:hypothetical protein